MNKSEQILTDVQERAVELMLSGRRPGEVAAELQVTKQTVSVWRHTDPVFIAALNAGRKAQQDFFQDKLRLAIGEVIDAVVDAAKAGDMSAAKLLFQACQFNLSAIGSADVAEIKRQQSLDKMFQRSATEVWLDGPNP